MKPVVNGAKLECSQGTALSSIAVSAGRKGGVRRSELATLQDHTPAINIPPFGMCRSPANPAVSAASGAPQPCVPVIPAPWSSPNSTVKVRGLPVIVDTSTCACAHGGTIRPAAAGQEGVKIVSGSAGSRKKSAQQDVGPRQTVDSRPREDARKPAETAMESVAKSAAKVALDEVPNRPRHTVIVIGSLAKGQAFQLQFVTAASYLDDGATTIWLVERTGYDLAGVSLESITRQAPRGGYRWITEREDLVYWLNKMPSSSIGKVIVFAHGLPGIIALRHGWDDLDKPDYGLTVDDIERMSSHAFTDDAILVLNACNTATIPIEFRASSKSIARALVDRIHRRVGAWTGRTSYRAINRGTCKVLPSRIAGHPWEQAKEIKARVLGREPEFVTYGTWGKEESWSKEWVPSPEELRHGG